MNINSKSVFVLFISLLFFTNATSQSAQKIDSLHGINDKDKIEKIVDSLRYIQGHHMYKNTDSVLYYTNLGLEFAKKINYHKEITNLSINMGAVYYSNGNYEKALHYFKQPLKTNIESNYHQGEYLSYVNMAKCYSAMNQYNKAISNYYNAIEALKKLDGGYPAAQAVLYSNIGEIYKSIKDYPKAIEIIQESISIIEKNNIDTFDSTIFNHNLLGEIYLQLKDYEKAEYYFKKAEEKFANEEKLEKRKLEVYLNLIDLHLELKEYSLVKEYIKIYEDININYNSNSHLNSRLNYAKAILCKNDNKFQLAKKYASKCLNTNESFQINIAKKASKLLLEISNHENDKKGVLKYMDLCTYYSDSLHKTDLQSSYFREKIDLEVSKVEYEKLKEKEKLEKAQLSKIKQYNIFLSAIIGFLLITLALLWFKDKKLVKAKNEEIASYKEKIELRKQIEVLENGIAEDLHDNFGNRIVGIQTISNILKDLISKGKINDDAYVKFSLLLDNSLESLSRDVKDLLWASRSKNNKLIALINRIKTTISTIEKNEKIQINLIYSENIKNLNLHKLTNKQILLTVKETVNNSIKHANASQIDIEFKVNKSNFLEVTIKDNGEGFDIDNLKRKSGVSHIKRRSQLINFKCEIVSGQSGTVVRLNSLTAFNY